MMGATSRWPLGALGWIAGFSVLFLLSVEGSSGELSTSAGVPDHTATESNEGQRGAEQVPPHVDLEFVTVGPGDFTRHVSSSSQPGDALVQDVTITRALEVGLTEVTVGQWLSVMGSEPRTWDARQQGLVLSPNQPVFWVCQTEVMEFANHLSRQAGLGECYALTGCDFADGCGCEEVTFAGLDCPGFRLPTEAEWELVARTAFCPDDTTCATFRFDSRVAWTRENSGGRVQPVANREPDRLGIYDLLGNVWEQTMDVYLDHGTAARVDPVFFGWSPGAYAPGSVVDIDAVVRGGSVEFASQFASPTYRGVGGLGLDVGFRLVRTVSD